MYEESGDKIYWNVVMEALVTKLIDKYLLCKPEPPENFVTEPVRMDTFVSTQVTDSFVPTNSLDAALSELLRDNSEKTQKKAAETLRVLLRDYAMCTVHKQKMEIILNKINKKFSDGIDMRTFTMCALYPGKK
jgi:hypothetical protein